MYEAHYSLHPSLGRGRERVRSLLISHRYSHSIVPAVDLQDNLGILMFLQRLYGVVILAGKHLVEQALHTAKVGIAVLVEKFLRLGNLSHIDIGRQSRFRSLRHSSNRLFLV